MECTTSFETLLAASVAGSGIVAISAMFGILLFYRYGLFNVPVANLVPVQTINPVHRIEV